MIKERFPHSPGPHYSEEESQVAPKAVLEGLQGDLDLEGYPVEPQELLRGELAAAGRENPHLEEAQGHFLVGDTGLESHSLL
jgi:hypothetical protein